MTSSNAPYYQVLPKGTPQHELKGSAAYPSQGDLNIAIEGTANAHNEREGANERLQSDTHHFAGLLEAVTSAAGQEAARNDILRQSAGEAIASMSASPNGSQVEHEQRTATSDRGKRKRTSTPIHPTRAKRRKPIQDHQYDDHNCYPPVGTTSESTSTGYTTQPCLSPSSALFPSRRSKSSVPKPARKHTRPPISQLYTSLHLSPSSFVELQAAAKTFMLDPRFPERRECVGSRSKGDDGAGTSGDAVRLRLWEVTKEFLEEGSVGERIFTGEGRDGQGNGSADGQDEDGYNEGEGSEMLNGRGYVWARDGDKIIALVMPLLRRMLTNERQRQYAVQTRRGSTNGVNEDRSKSMTNEDTSHNGQRTIGIAEQQAQSPDMHIDPSITLTPFQRPAQAAPSLPTSVPFSQPHHSNDSTANLRTFQIHILHHSTQTYMIPRFELPAQAYPTLLSLKKYLEDNIPGKESFSIKVHALNGLVEVAGEDDWTRIVEECNRCVWMEGCLRVVVEVE